MWSTVIAEQDVTSGRGRLSTRARLNRSEEIARPVTAHNWTGLQSDRTWDDAHSRGPGVVKEADGGETEHVVEQRKGNDRAQPQQDHHLPSLLFHSRIHSLCTHPKNGL